MIFVDDYDTDDSESDNDEVNDETGSDVNNQILENTEHSNPASFSWTILRLAVIKMLLKHVHDFINVSGIDVHGIFLQNKRKHKFL